jgi:hypothetical protein
MNKHGSHIKYIDLEIKHKNHQTITTKVDNEVQQYRLHLWAFVSMGEAFLFLFKASKVHHKNANVVRSLPTIVEPK